MTGSTRNAYGSLQPVDYPDWLEAERADSDARAFGVGPAAEVSDDWGGRA